jgi:hypothetical protein
LGANSGELGGVMDALLPVTGLTDSHSEPDFEEERTSGDVPKSSRNAVPPTAAVV